MKIYYYYYYYYKSRKIWLNASPSNVKSAPMHYFVILQLADYKDCEKQNQSNMKQSKGVTESGSSKTSKFQNVWENYEIL